MLKLKKNRFLLKKFIKKKYKIDNNSRNLRFINNFFYNNESFFFVCNSNIVFKIALNNINTGYIRFCFLIVIIL